MPLETMSLTKLAAIPTTMIMLITSKTLTKAKVLLRGAAP